MYINVLFQVYINSVLSISAFPYQMNLALVLKEQIYW